MNTITTAFVLGAGLGTRLRPLTENTPKPLLPVNGEPMAAHVFRRLQAVGVKRIVVNTHHAAECWRHAFPENNWNGIELEFSHEPILLGTAGGMKNIEELLGGETFILHSGDVLTNFPLQELIDYHQTHNAEVTLALRKREELQTIGRLPNGHILYVGKGPVPVDLEALDYANIAVIDSHFLQRVPNVRPRELATVWSEMAADDGCLIGYAHHRHWWFNVSTPAEYESVCLELPQLISE